MAAVWLTLSLSHTPVRADHELESRDIRFGESVYATHCAVCHGAQLEGQPDWRVRKADGSLPAPPHDKTGHTWHHDNTYLFTYTKYGGAAVMARLGFEDMRSGMPAFGTALDDDAIWAVLAFIRSTWPDDIKAIQAERNPDH
ncbi:MAG: cytochrome c [Pseudomonadota bacterium]